MTEQDEAKLAALKAQHPEWGRGKLAEASGVQPSAVGRWLARIKKKAMSNGAEDGYFVKGKSTCRNADGEVVLEWTKTNIEKEEEFNLLQFAVDDMVSECRGKSVIIKPPPLCKSNLIACYPIPDVHHGLYAWGEENGGIDWDTDKSERAIVSAMSYLVDSAPATDLCLIANLADFFHTDNERNQTERSGHNLDVDSRQAKVFISGVRAFRRMIELALAKHKKVVVKFSKGNHDDHSILALAAVMEAYFENNSRVEIHLPINPFSYLEFGSNLYGMHHGNLKRDKYPLIMAADMPEAWGRTKYRTFFTAHIHHETMLEMPGCKVESLGAPTAPDVYTHGSGYRSRRDMQLIVADKDRGEISRTRIGVDSL
jgi:hypothetical protein